MGGIVEAFIEGDVKKSPSVQYRITPATIETVSTHDQLLGGADGQIFLGAYFPASGLSLPVAYTKKGKLNSHQWRRQISFSKYISSVQT